MVSKQGRGVRGRLETRNLDLIDKNMFLAPREDARNQQDLESSNTLILYEKQTDMPYEASETPNMAQVPILEIPSEITTRIVHVFGLNSQGHLTYLHRDSWICSVDLQTVQPGALRYYRHFFLPYGWFSSTWGCIAGLTKRDIVYARGGDVAIVKGGLEISELLNLESS